MSSKSIACVTAIVLCGAGPLLADSKIATRYVADGQTTETVIYAKGERLRYNYGKGESLIRQCDQNRLIQVDDNAKTFVSLPGEQPAAADASKPVAQTTVVDTGEKKELFGFQASHLKMTTTTEGKKERTETDGWYIDLKDLPSCAMPKPTAKTDAPTPGYPAAYTITTFGENGKPTATITMQVTDLSRDPLDSKLFEPPVDYKDGSKTAESKPPAEKASGTIRVAAVPMRNKSAQQNPSNAAYSRLLSQLQDAKVDVFPVTEGSDDAIKTKAAQAQCDYILYTELVSVERPATGKVGGLLHKTPIVGKATDGNAFEAKVDYRLIPVVEGKPDLSASAVAKTGHAFNWVGAASLASNFIPMTMAAKMFGGTGGLNPAMLNALLKNGGSGNAMTGMDPMFSGMSMFLRGANAMGGGPANGAAANPAGMDAAIAAALEQQGKAVLAHLKM